MPCVRDYSALSVYAQIAVSLRQNKDRLHGVEPVSGHSLSSTTLRGLMPPQALKKAINASMSLRSIVYFPALSSLSNSRILACVFSSDSGTISPPSNVPSGNSFAPRSFVAVARAVSSYLARNSGR